MWLMLHSKHVFEDKTTNHCDWQGTSISFVSRVLVLSHFSLFYFLFNAQSHTLRVPFPPISVSRSNGRFYRYFMANFDARSLVTSNPGRWVVSFDRSWQESKGAIDWEMQQETRGPFTGRNDELLHKYFSRCLFFILSIPCHFRWFNEIRSGIWIWRIHEFQQVKYRSKSF